MRKFGYQKIFGGFVFGVHRFKTAQINLMITLRAKLFCQLIHKLIVWICRVQGTLQ